MRGLIAVLVVVAAATPLAQQPPQPPPVFRGGTDLVEVDVVVRDRDGNFVADLTADDFVVEESGQPQSIVVFYVRAAGRPAVPATSIPGANAGRAPVASTRRPRALVVVLDDEHLTSAGFRRAQAAAEALFTDEFQAGDIGGFIVGGRMANDRLTSDRDELIRAIKKAKPRGSANGVLLELQRWPRMNESELFAIARGAQDVLDEVVRRACYDDPGQCSGAGGPEFARSAIQQKGRQLSAVLRAGANNTLHTMTRLFDGLGQFDRRKIVLLISEGFLTEDSTALLRQSAAAAARADVRVYSADAKGLDTHRLGEHLRGDTAGNTEALGDLLNVEADSGALSDLAAESGGAFVRNANDLGRAVRLIGDDSVNHYVIAFRPAAYDGKYHPLKVSVKRAGVSVRARRGYLAPTASTSTAASAAGAAATSTAAPSPEPAIEAPAASPDADAAARLRAEEPIRPSRARSAETEPAGPVPAVTAKIRPHATENARRLAPSTVADADASEGWAAFQRGDVESAYARLSAAAARPDAHAWVHYTLGISSYALGRYEQAADAWERVRTAASEFEPVYFDLIDAYLQQREYDRAVRTARAALEHWPKDAELYQALGVVQTVRGSLDDAVKSFREALAIAPQDANAYFNLGKAMELKYARSRHYVSQLRKWVSNEHDRKAAIENYRRHIELGGAYTDSARAGLQRLEWAPVK